ncbi:3-oxoacyl-[acyl-carrier-protein] synthase III C-terminal domain-containing protein [Snodgrassella communis]|uniref:3-oxoacyl-[acyl-carrier-protein] synthase III C-terminal domain-containing protein n=1 Tax=Snodgrassella communis TaxID=2946699 RepID=UPI00286BED1F|nr:3-oxoacyl-[acyl-carrier-protein] synthase III C-terminal domain-containing protein [Snodgrassella communis]WMY91522.1 3-oxoacyl-[acyl-carrier-protein] synthase III C-terminal domain-containing protein [Snodgrassella communis]
MFNDNEIPIKTLVPIKIIATGVALPPDKLEATELDKKLNKPVGYSLKRSGILYRYHADHQLQQADLAAKAIDDALNRCDIAAQSIDLLISACALPVQALPYTAVHILKASSLPKTIASLDVNVSCVSFISALQVAAGLLNTGAYRRIAIVSADLASRGLNWQDEESSLIFGDGAACAIVEQGDGRSGILSCLFETHTDGIDLCEIRGGGSRRNLRTGMDESDCLFHMQGKPLFRLASSLIEPYLARLLNQAGLTLADIATVIPHQASHLSLEHMRKRLNVASDALIDIYRFRGNQVAASIPSALHEAIITQRFNPGKPVMLIGTAAGLTLGGMILLP